jgi:hypothetical protein
MTEFGGVWNIFSDAMGLRALQDLRMCSLIIQAKGLASTTLTWMFNVPILPIAVTMPFSTSIHSAVESLSSTVYMLLGDVHIAYLLGMPMMASVKMNFWWKNERRRAARTGISLGHTALWWWWNEWTCELELN